MIELHVILVKVANQLKKIAKIVNECLKVRACDRTKKNTPYNTPLVGASM